MSHKQLLDHMLMILSDWHSIPREFRLMESVEKTLVEFYYQRHRVLGDETKSAIKKLSREGYIEKRWMSRGEYFALTSEGRLFLDNGGYLGLELKQLQEAEERASELETETRLQGKQEKFWDTSSERNRQQMIYFWIALLFMLIGILVTLFFTK